MAIKDCGIVYFWKVVKDWGKNVADPDFEDLSGTAAMGETAHSLAMGPAYVATAKGVTLSFTPLHTSGLEDGRTEDRLDVWGSTPCPKARRKARINIKFYLSIFALHHHHATMIYWDEHRPRRPSSSCKDNAEERRMDDVM